MFCVIIRDAITGDIIGRICEPASKKQFSDNRPMVFTGEDAQRKVEFLNKLRSVRKGLSHDFYYDVAPAGSFLRVWHMRRNMLRAVLAWQQAAA